MVRADRMEVRSSFQQRGAERVKGLERVFVSHCEGARHRSFSDLSWGRQYILGGAVPAAAAMKTSVKAFNSNFNKIMWKFGLCFRGSKQLSQILAMNFGSFTTRGHSPITWTFTPHSYRSLIDCISHHPLHQHSCSQWSRLHLFSISQSPSPNHTHTHTLHKPWTFSHSLPSTVSPATYQAFPSIPS